MSRHDYRREPSEASRRPILEQEGRATAKYRLRVISSGLRTRLQQMTKMVSEYEVSRVKFSLRYSFYLAAGETVEGNRIIRVNSCPLREDWIRSLQFQCEFERIHTGHLPHWDTLQTTINSRGNIGKGRLPFG